MMENLKVFPDMIRAQKIVDSVDNPFIRQIEEISKFQNAVIPLNSALMEAMQQLGAINKIDIIHGFSHGMSGGLIKEIELLRELQKNYSRFDFSLYNKSLSSILHNKFPNSEEVISYEYNFEEVYEEKEISKEIIIDDSKNIKGLIAEIYQNNNFIYTLDPRKFEEVIAELLYKKGFEVQLTKQTRDNGYDIIALQNLKGFHTKFLVECKRYAARRPVGIEVIRSFSDVISEENANKGILVTTSYFTKPVIERKTKMGHMLDLVDKDEILIWMFEYLCNG